MSRPVIGISTDYGEKRDRSELQFHYSRSVEKAGGIAFPISCGTDAKLVGEILDLVDGMLFSGGDDLDPALYGQSRHPRAIAIDPLRQEFELALLRETEKRRLPVLGICLGCQLINVHRGGSLHQFLPDVQREAALEHRKLEAELRRHTVEIEPGSILALAIGKMRIDANTYHKQAIDRVGKGLRVVASAPDGVIEAIEDDSLPLMLGVQWHPERLSDEPDHLALFELLVKKAGEQRA